MSDRLLLTVMLGSAFLCGCQSRYFTYIRAENTDDADAPVVLAWSEADKDIEGGDGLVHAFVISHEYFDAISDMLTIIDSDASIPLGSLSKEHGHAPLFTWDGGRPTGIDMKMIILDGMQFDWDGCRVELDGVALAPGITIRQLADAIGKVITISEVRIKGDAKSDRSIVDAFNRKYSVQ